MWQLLCNLGKNKTKPKRLKSEIVDYLDAFATATDTRWVESPDTVKLLQELGFHCNRFGELMPPFAENLYFFKRNKKVCCAMGFMDNILETNPDFISRAFNWGRDLKDLEFVITTALSKHLPYANVVYMYYSVENPPKGFNILALDDNTERSCD